jgi:hypothetical protein
MRALLRIGIAGVGLLVCGAGARGQASALPSAEPGADDKATPQTSANPLADKGRALLDAMVKGLGGDAWLNREDWVFHGREATFYKGQPHEGAPEFEEYYRAQPFGERVTIISSYGVFISTDHRDLAEVWTKDDGFEVSYKGVKELPVKQVEDYQRRRRHSLEVVIEEWLKQPGVLVTYEGSGMVERRLAEKVSVLTASNDAVAMELDETTHLPLRISFEWRDPLYNDLNKDELEFDDYHEVQGIMTAFAITRLHNGEMTGQRFLTKASYNAKLPADLFDPTRKLEKKAK